MTEITQEEAVIVTLYYDDKSKANLMERDFKVKLTGNSEFVQYEPSIKWSVHPNSYDIFKPQVGDIMVITETDLPHVEHLTSKSQCDEYVHLMETRGAKIIYRNGKVFFMPEVKEDK